MQSSWLELLILTLIQYASRASEFLPVLVRIHVYTYSYSYSTSVLATSIARHRRRALMIAD